MIEFSEQAHVLHFRGMRVHVRVRVHVHVRPATATVPAATLQKPVLLSRPTSALHAASKSNSVHHRRRYANCAGVRCRVFVSSKLAVSAGTAG